MKPILNQKRERELKELSVITCQGLIEAYKNDELREYISEEALEIRKDGDGDISQIVFSLGGPYVHLDLYGGRFGCVVAEDLEHITQSAIPMSIWADMRDELEGYYEAN